MEEIIKLAVKDVIDSYPSMRYNKQKIKEVVIGLFTTPISSVKLDHAIEEVFDERKI